MITLGPSTNSDKMLKRIKHKRVDFLRINMSHTNIDDLKSYINWKSLAGIFGHTKGIGWFMLPKGWWYKPREVLEIAKIGVYLLTNIILTSLPLRLTEPFMCWLNPSLKKRQRVAGYDPSTYKEIDWDRMETRNKAVLLKKARDELKESGTFNVKVKANSITN